MDNTNRLLKAMTARGINRAIVMARPGVSNDDVAKMATQHPDILAAQMRLGSDQQLSGYPADPKNYREAAPDEISRCVEQFGVVGIGEIFIRSLTREVHPELIADDLGPIVERCIETDIPIAFPTGWSQWKGGLHYGNPTWVDELAGRYPHARILLTKMGRGTVSIFDSVIAVTMRNANVYLDMTHTTPEHLTEAVHMLGAARIMYGSDWSATWQHLSAPNDVHGLALDIVQTANISNDDRNLILAGTARQFFKLDAKWPTSL